MRTETNNGKLTIYLEGRIDSANAAEKEQEIFAATDSAADAVPVLDAEGLEYISSAGLRVLMKLRKQMGKPLTVMNVSPEVYEIFDTTGFTELLDVQKRLRTVNIEGCDLLGEGANGKVYRFTEDEMVKVFRPEITLDVIEQERLASRKAFLSGVPCAIPFDTVRCGESYGTIYELLKAATLTERIREKPETLSHYAESSGKLLRQLHEIEVPEGDMPDASRLLHNTIDIVAEDFTPDETELMHRIYNAIPKMNRFIHNDYHTKNIMESGGELILIDLGDAGAGNPFIDLIHCKMVYNLIGSGTKQRSADEIAFIGLTYGEMERFWEIFLTAYCGDPAEAERMNKLLTPYAQMMYLSVSMSHPMLPKEHHASYADKMRAEVFPHAEEMLDIKF